MNRLLYIIMYVMVILSCRVSHEEAQKPPATPPPVMPPSFSPPATPPPATPPPILDDESVGSTTDDVVNRDSLLRSGGDGLLTPLDPEEDDPIFSEERDDAERQRLDREMAAENMRLFNEQIRNTVVSKRHYVEIHQYLERGNRSGELRSILTFDSQVVYRYVLAEELDNYLQPYPYDQEDAPDWQTLANEGYMVAYMNKPYKDYSKILYANIYTPMRLFWDSTKEPPLLLVNRSESLRLHKSDEGIYNRDSYSYDDNYFTVKEITLSDDISRVKWINQSPYRDDRRYRMDGTKVVLLLGLYVCFCDVQTGSAFYRLLTFDTDAIKMYPEPFTYVIRNPHD